MTTLKKIKKTKQKFNPKTEKKTVQLNDPGEYDKLKASWRFHRNWKATSYPLSVDNWKEWENNILPKLIDYQTLTWGEIKSTPKSHGTGSRSHNIDISGLSEEGLSELKRLNMDGEVDRIFSLRLDGTKRIIGILDRGVLEILCYTPNHEFTKTSKK